jgi:hypothetical protein
VPSFRPVKSSVTPDGTAKAERTIVEQDVLDALAAEYPVEPAKVHPPAAAADPVAAEPEPVAVAALAVVLAVVVFAVVLAVVVVLAATLLVVEVFPVAEALAFWTPGRGAGDAKTADAPRSAMRAMGSMVKKYSVSNAA